MLRVLRPTRAGTAVACLTLMLAGSASAAAPVARDDAMTAAPTGVVDVLGNDADPDADALTVEVSDPPAKGTVTCSPLGACFYEAADATAAPDADSFGYRVRDPGGDTATATVAVTIAVNTGVDDLEARDDEAAALEGGIAVTIDVLANDSPDDGVVVASNTDPSHGTVDCPQNGRCVYEPAPGFSGADGFHYTIRDAGGQERTADVHVLVAPEAAQWGVQARGSAETPAAGGAVPSGGFARWAFAVGQSPAGLSGDELRALVPPRLDTELLPDGDGDPHGLVDPTGVTTAPGWTATQRSGGRVEAEAGEDALLGEGETEPFPTPLPPISQGTGGDGHVPILVGSKVFAFFHHQSPTRVTCVDRRTGKGCPGYPKQVPFATNDLNGPAVVVGSRMWVHLLPTGARGGATVPIMLFCWDAETDSTCGLAIVDRVANAFPGGSPPWLAGGRMWFGADTGRLYCVDPADGEACDTTPSIDTGLGEQFGRIYDAISHGTRVFVGRDTGRVACVDVAARTRCPGWDAAKDFGGRWNVINWHSTTGAVIGVCVIASGRGECVRDDAPDTREPLTNFPATFDNRYNPTLEAETGTRTIIGGLDSQGVGCYDWTTKAPCTGGDFRPDGWLRTASDGSPLPSRGAYGVAWDGSCAVALGDQGVVYTVDPAGTSPCLSLNSGARGLTVDLRDQRCDGTPGAATWDEVLLQDTSAAEMDTVTVRVLDAATKEVLKTADLVNGALDLSDIDAGEHPALEFEATALSRPGTNAWSDAIPPRLRVRWHADEQSLCLRTAATDACSEASPTTIGVRGRLLSTGGPIGTFVPPGDRATATLALLRRPCTGQPPGPGDGGGGGGGGAAAPPAGTGAPSGTATSQGQFAPVPRPAPVTEMRACQGARRFRIHIAYPARRIGGLLVTVLGVPQRIVRRRPRAIAIVDLRGLGRRQIRVRIRIRTVSGRVLRGVRVYHPCVPERLPDRGYRF